MQITDIGGRKRVITVVIFFLMNLSLAGCVSEKQYERRYEQLRQIYEPLFTYGEQNIVIRKYPYPVDNNLYLFKAASKGDLKMLKLCIQHGTDVNMKQSYSYALSKFVSMTPLMEAAANGNLEIVKLLLNNGAEINKKFSDANFNRTAISLAYSRGKLDVYDYLKSRGAIEDK